MLLHCLFTWTGICGCPSWKIHTAKLHSLNTIYLNIIKPFWHDSFILHIMGLIKCTSPTVMLVYLKLWSTSNIYNYFSIHYYYWVLCQSGLQCEWVNICWYSMLSRELQQWFAYKRQLDICIMLDLVSTLEPHLEKTLLKMS